MEKNRLAEVIATAEDRSSSTIKLPSRMMTGMIFAATEAKFTSTASFLVSQSELATGVGFSMAAIAFMGSLSRLSYKLIEHGSEDLVVGACGVVLGAIVVYGLARESTMYYMIQSIKELRKPTP